jgi:hypothetical protein
MIMGYFSALLPLVLATSLQSTAPATPSATPQACPIKITGDGVRVHFRNDSDKPVSDVIFHTMVLDAVGDEYKQTDVGDPTNALFASSSRPEQTYSNKKGVNPGEAKTMTDNMTIYGKPDKGLQIVTYVRAIKFEDGTTWKDDGSHACRWGGR